MAWILAHVTWIYGFLIYFHIFFSLEQKTKNLTPQNGNCVCVYMRVKWCVNYWSTTFNKHVLCWNLLMYGSDPKVVTIHDFVPFFNWKVVTKVVMLLLQVHTSHSMNESRWMVRGCATMRIMACSFWYTPDQHWNDLCLSNWNPKLH